MWRIASGSLLIGTYGPVFQWRKYEYLDAYYVSLENREGFVFALFKGFVQLSTMESQKAIKVGRL